VKTVCDLTVRTAPVLSELTPESQTMPSETPVSQSVEGTGVPTTQQAAEQTSTTQWQMTTSEEVIVQKTGDVTTQITETSGPQSQVGERVFLAPKKWG